MKMYFSQIGQDKILNEEVFNGATNGVFCDVGAHDGMSSSNSIFFEKSLGWTGVCVEADPKHLNVLQENRSCHIVSAAAYDRDGEVTFTSNVGYTDMLSGIDQAYNDAHRDRIQKELAEHGGTSSKITVPCKRLSTIFEKLEMPVVDYLSIDTEGSELSVLQGIDFDKVKINCIDFEVNYPGSLEHLRTREFLESMGFRYLMNISWDEIWINNDLRWSWTIYEILQSTVKSE
jgi:FkbM family methyltransferase